MSELDKLIERMHESIEMMKDGYQENLTPTWHTHAMQQAADDLIDAMEAILKLSPPKPSTGADNE